MEPSTAQIVALAASGISILVSATALGWNIYRDVILRPRLRVSFSISRTISPGSGEPPSPQFLCISMTNHGPGKLIVVGAHCQSAPLWRLILRRTKKYLLLHEHRDPRCARIPCRLDVGEVAHVTLPYNAASFVRDSKLTRVGVLDTFGRFHWAPTKELRQAQRTWHADFQGAPALETAAPTPAPARRARRTTTGSDLLD